MNFFYKKKIKKIEEIALSTSFEMRYPNNLLFRRLREKKENPTNKSKRKKGSRHCVREFIDKMTQDPKNEFFYKIRGHIICGRLWQA